GHGHRGVPERAPSGTDALREREGRTAGDVRHRSGEVRSDRRLDRALPLLRRLHGHRRGLAARSRRLPRPRAMKRLAVLLAVACSSAPPPTFGSITTVTSSACNASFEVYGAPA